MKNIVLTIALSVLSFWGIAQKKSKGKILIVVSSHAELGNTGKQTGYYLSEVSHPWEVFTKAGYEVDFVSPQGGKPPVDGFDLTDKVNKEFWENAVYKNKLDHTLTPKQVKASNYVAIHYAGGHGTMWDFPNNEELAKIANKIYEKGGVVSAVCHGPSGLLNIRLGNNRYLLEGKNVAGFSNEEEIAVKLEKVVPFSLEDELKKRGVHYSSAPAWSEYVVVDGKLVTGQNPQSAKKMAEEGVLVLGKK